MRFKLNSQTSQYCAVARERVLKDNCNAYLHTSSLLRVPIPCRYFTPCIPLLYTSYSYSPSLAPHSLHLFPSSLLSSLLPLPPLSFLSSSLLPPPYLFPLHVLISLLFASIFQLASQLGRGVGICTVLISSYIARDSSQDTNNSSHACMHSACYESRSPIVARLLESTSSQSRVKTVPVTVSCALDNDVANLRSSTKRRRQL